MNLAANEPALILAQAAPREGLQSIFFALTVGLAIVIAFNFKKLGVVVAAVVVWFVALAVAYTPESGLEAIGTAVGSGFEWVVETIFT